MTDKMPDGARKAPSKPAGGTELTYRGLLRQYGLERHPADKLSKIVIHPTRQIWVWIPKNAGRAIANALLATHGTGAVPVALPIPILHALLGPDRRYEVIAFQRNPYTRAASVWTNKVVAATPRKRDLIGRYRKMRERMSFDDFAAWLNTRHGSDVDADPHWMSQHVLLEQIDRKLRFEDLPEAATALGINPDTIEQANSSEKDLRKAGLGKWAARHGFNAPADEATWNRRLRLIAKRYRRDFEILGYDPDDTDWLREPAATAR